MGPCLRSEERVDAPTAIEPNSRPTPSSGQRRPQPAEPPCRTEAPSRVPKPAPSTVSLAPQPAAERLKAAQTREAKPNPGRPGDDELADEPRGRRAPRRGVRCLPSRERSVGENRGRRRRRRSRRRHPGTAAISPPTDPSLPRCRFPAPGGNRSSKAGEGGAWVGSKESRSGRSREQPRSRPGRHRTRRVAACHVQRAEAHPRLDLTWRAWMFVLVTVGVVTFLITLVVAA